MDDPAPHRQRRRLNFVNASSSRVQAIGASLRSMNRKSLLFAAAGAAILLASGPAYAGAGAMAQHVRDQGGRGDGGGRRDEGQRVQQQQQPRQNFGDNGARQWQGRRDGGDNGAAQRQAQNRWGQNNGQSGGDQGGGNQNWRGGQGRTPQVQQPQQAQQNWRNNNNNRDRNWSGNNNNRGWNSGWNDNRDRRSYAAIPYGRYFGPSYGSIASRFYGRNYIYYGSRSWSSWDRPYRVGYILPPTLYCSELPYDLYYDLPPPPYGYDYALCGRDILLVGLDSRLVIDAIVGWY
jgi:hypothetical protein